MSHWRRVFVVGIVAFAAFAFTGCGTMRETLPGRSAMEQLLISSAADKAIASLPVSNFEGKAVFLDFASLDAYDKPYVTQRIRDRVLSSGASVLPEKEGAEVVLEVASGGLSFNKRDFLFGVPGVSIPTGEGSLSTPELPIFKALFYRGKAKLVFTAIDPAANKELWQVPVCYGKSHQSLWWFLLFGPFVSNDLPEELD